MSDALVLRDVTKRYSGHTAVERLSLEVPSGSIYGILGPNGAGKSSTLRMVMNILARDGGEIEVLGRDPARDADVLRRLGYLPEERGLYRKMKVIDVIIFFALLKGVSGGDARRDGLAWLDRMGLGDWADKKVDTLSKGMQQKVQFITTVLHRPDMLILDEPHAGLDPVNQEVLRDTILQAKADGRTVVLSTHNMAEAERLCDAVCIIAAGRKVLDGAVADVRRAHRGNRFYIEFDTRDAAVDRFMRLNQYIVEVKEKGGGWEIELDARAETRAVLAELNQLDHPLTHFEHLQPTLHDIFVAQVTGTTQPTRRPEPTHA